MKTKLATKLFDKCHELMNEGVTNIKDYEYEFQEVIREVFPDKCWWETVDCDIFMHLLSYKDPEKTVIAILKGLKEV